MPRMLWLARDFAVYEGDTRARRCRAWPRVRVVAAVGSLVRHLRRRRSPHVTGPPLAAGRDALLEPGAARRAVRVPDRAPIASTFSIRPALARLGVRVVRPCCATSRRPAPSAPSSCPAIPAWCGSIRAGTRRRWRFVRLGFLHILDGTDHLLFLVPGDPVPPVPRAGRDRDRVHRRAFDHADRRRRSASRRTRCGSRRWSRR